MCEYAYEYDRELREYLDSLLPNLKTRHLLLFYEILLEKFGVSLPPDDSAAEDLVHASYGRGNKAQAREAFVKSLRLLVNSIPAGTEPSTLLKIIYDVSEGGFRCSRKQLRAAFKENYEDLVTKLS